MFENTWDAVGENKQQLGHVRLKVREGGKQSSNNSEEVQLKIGSALSHIEYSTVCEGDPMRRRGERYLVRWCLHHQLY